MAPTHNDKHGKNKHFLHHFTTNKHAKNHELSAEAEELVRLIALFNESTEILWGTAGALPTNHIPQERNEYNHLMRDLKHMRTTITHQQMKLKNGKQTVEKTRENIEKAAVTFQQAISHHSKKLTEEKTNQFILEGGGVKSHTAFTNLNNNLAELMAKLAHQNPKSKSVTSFKGIVKAIMNTIRHKTNKHKQFTTALEGMRTKGKNLLSEKEKQLKKEKIKQLVSIIEAGKVAEDNKELIELFNLDPQKAYKTWIDLDPDNPVNDKLFAQFLRSPELDKVKIGEFLGEGKEKSEIIPAVLQEYADTFKFSKSNSEEPEGEHFCNAMRHFLEAFRLPGEAQKISRIVNAFAAEYIKQNPKSTVFANKDTAYVLAYSIIMLNTDAHNPQVKKKMTGDEFIRNNRGINDGNDLDKDFLKSIYHEITTNEIKMKEKTPKPTPRK